MAIQMQGNWIVRVKSKNAAFPQHFAIRGSNNPATNQVYENPAPGTEIYVEGNQWVIDILHDAGGTNRQPSELQITFPQQVGSVYQFDIQSNDSGGDSDFNDLVLTCRTPVTGEDYLVYGQARYYEGICLLPPCSPGFIVIDHYESFLEAVKVPRLRAILSEQYGARIGRMLRNPDSPEARQDFRPLLLPLRDGALVPTREQVLTHLKPGKLTFSTGEDQQQNLAFQTIARQRTVATAALPERISAAARRDLGKLATNLRLFCAGGPLPFAPLRFLEYDRTPDELAGGPYSGEGGRELLGQSYTDRNGRYIFRFKRSDLDAVQEAIEDTGTGEDWTAQIKPDLIPQLMNETGDRVLHETAPRWNIGFLTRIDLCIPKSKLDVVPYVCGDNDNMIQRIGNLEIGAPGNALSPQGRITSDALNQHCAAWRGVIDIQGCMSEPAIRYFAVRYQTDAMAGPQPIPDALFLQSYQSPTSIISEPVDVTTYVNVDLDDTGTKAVHKVFHNPETYVGNPAAPYLWTEYSKRLKARLYTSRYDNGRTRFFFTTYDQSGNKLPFEHQLTLYIDNQYPNADLFDEVTIAGKPKGNCALFELTEGELSQPIEVKIRVEHLNGFMGDYRLFVQKGAEPGNKIVTNVVGTVFDLGTGRLVAESAQTGRLFTATPANCLRGFRGTADEPLGALDSEGYLTLQLQPSAGAWLESGQQFCAFSIRLDGHTRHTNGTNSPVKFSATPVNIGIQRMAPASEA